MEQWESNRIERLEKRVAELEWKNAERSLFMFRLTMYGFTTAFVILVIVTITLQAANPGHG